MGEPSAIAGETRPTWLSIGIIAWNEEGGIAHMLESVFQQSLFEWLEQRGLHGEILCLANGCTDRTALIAGTVFEEQARKRPHRRSVNCRVVEIPERGKLNAWNRFVHEHSARGAKYLILMDADISVGGKETLTNMVALLERDFRVQVATDRPVKQICGKPGKSFMDQLSMQTSRLTQAGEGQLCGQLYCIRSEVARRIYLPRELAACDDGFIKALVCTDFLSTEVVPERIQVAPGAFHFFEPYTSVGDILRNQKRQMIGQTMVHVLVDDFLRKLSAAQRIELARTLQELERNDPDWFKGLIAEHLRRTRYFWRLIPGLARTRLGQLKKLRGMNRVFCAPVAVAGYVVALASCFRARAFLEAGQTQYWPHARTGAHV